MEIEAVVELWARLVKMKLEDEESPQVDWVAIVVEEEMDMEIVVELGLVVVEVVQSPSSAALEIPKGLRSSRP